MAETQARGNLNPQTLISAAVVLIMAFGGIWTLFQAQLANVDKEISEAKEIGASQRRELAFRIDQQNAEIKTEEETLRSDIASVLMPRKEFEEFQLRFSALNAEVTRLQLETHAAALATARNPVEAATLKAIDDDFNKRIDLIQAQITGQVGDLNKQIAALLEIVNSNNNQTGYREAMPKPTSP